MTDKTVCMPTETFNLIVKGNTTALNEYIEEKKTARSGSFLALMVAINFVVLTAAVALGTYIV